MPKSNDVSDPIAVDAHIQKLDKDVAELVQTIREIILNCDSLIGERIKWNNPSFFYSGPMKPFDPKTYKREIAVFNLFKGRIMLVFPHGATSAHSKGFLEGNYPDGRRLLIIKDLNHAKKIKTDLEIVIRELLSKME